MKICPAVAEPNLLFSSCQLSPTYRIHSLQSSMSTSAKGTTTTSYELASPTARVTSVKYPKHHWLTDWVTDKGRQCNDLTRIDKKYYCIWLYMTVGYLILFTASGGVTAVCLPYERLKGKLVRRELWSHIKRALSVSPSYISHWENGNVSKNIEGKNDRDVRGKFEDWTLERFQKLHIP